VAGTETYQKVPTGWLSLKTGTTLGFGVPDPPPPVSPKLIGIFTSGNNQSSGSSNVRQDSRYPGLTIVNTPVDTLTASWPTKPNLGSFYMGWNVTVASTPLMATWAGQGRVLQVELATGTSIFWADIATGTYDAKILSFINSLDNLGTRVLLSLDNEADLKISNGQAASGQTAAQYKAAANRMADLIHGNADNVESSCWLAGSGANVASFLPDVGKLDNVGWDPYKVGTHPASETPTQTFAAFITNTLVPNGYSAVKRHIFETGIKTDLFTSGGSFTVAQQIAYYQGIPAAMDANQIESVIWFRANSGSHNYIPTDVTVDNAFRDMLDAAVGD
jgi:hypothetical protein